MAVIATPRCFYCSTGLAVLCGAGVGGANLTPNPRSDTERGP